MICIPVTCGTNKEALRAIKRSCRLVDLIELRMDLIGGGNLAELICAARKESGSIKIIVTCRKKEEAAGTKLIKNSAGDKIDKKIGLLKEAIELGADFVDIELALGSKVIRELKTFCAKRGRKTGIIVSYHNVKETPALPELRAIFNQCKKYKPAVIKIVTTAKTFEDNLTVLSLISYAKERSQKIISLCMGDKGIISRAVAPLMGSYFSFVVMDKSGISAPGQLTVAETKQIETLFKLKKTMSSTPVLSLPAKSPQNYILMGNPVGHSLSPLMHNAALKNMGIQGHYSAFCVSDLSGAMQGLRGMNIRGASVTIPFKVDVMEYLDDIDDDALEIGAVNTIVNVDGRLRGCNTDWLGLILALKQAMPVKNKSFVIIGAGGTARAAAYGIIREGGFPIIANRTAQKGRVLSDKYDCPFYSLSAIGWIKADCLVNTTSVGMYPQKDKSPVKMKMLGGYKYVMDVIYNPLKTKLLNDAEKQGCRIISGVEMFVNQGAEQLRLWTGKEPPRALMKKVIREGLTEK